MQGIYTHIPERNHVSRTYIAAAILYLQLMVHVMLFPTQNVLYFYVSIIIIIIIIIISSSSSSSSSSLLSQAFPPCCFSFWPCCDPHRSGFQFQTAVLCDVAYFISLKATCWCSFLNSCFSDSKLCPSLLDNIPSCNVRNYNQFFAARKNCPSARRAAGANLACCDTYMLCKGIQSLRQTLWN